jgi:hypothetical protein
MLEYLVDRKVTLEDEVATIFDLIYRIVTLLVVRSFPENFGPSSQVQ